MCRWSLSLQVAELQDELKRREARWSAASTRSRQRIEALEQEKKELQDDVKLLEQYRLQQWREDEQAKVGLKKTYFFGTETCVIPIQIVCENDAPFSIKKFFSLMFFFLSFS